MPAKDKPLWRRPYAQLVVHKEADGWWVRVAGREFGPNPSKRRAVAAAIAFAEGTVKQGKTALVQVQTGPADFETVWPKPEKQKGRP